MAVFDFMQAEFPHLVDDANEAANTALFNPVTACFHARRALELSVNWAYEVDADLTQPKHTNLRSLVDAPTFRSLISDTIYGFVDKVIKLGNTAAHALKPPTREDAVTSVSALFEYFYWFGRTYALEAKPPPDLRFDPASLPSPAPQALALPAGPETVRELRALQGQLVQLEKDKDLAHQRVRQLQVERGELDAELALLQAKVAAAKRQARAVADQHDYSEAETRDFFIDVLLREAGWPLVPGRDTEVEVNGLPTTPSGRGWVDYVLWGDDGKPLALVEAKASRHSPDRGRQQAHAYADALETAHGQRPIIFLTNGYQHSIWDDAFYPPRHVQGFYKKDELELLVQRRRIRRPLADIDVDPTIADRFYQQRAIRRITETFEQDNKRKALLVMATGAGKTRTVVGLADVLLKANWVKRVLFLADRTKLVEQATGVFKRFLPSSGPVNLLEDPHDDGRVCVSTYPTMMGLIDREVGAVRRFGPGYFDLVVVDEAHRSIFNKYRALIDYFDALLVGLTATPRSEVDRDTYGTFDLKPGQPTDAYDLDEAVRDGYLVPPKAVSIHLDIPTRGLRYDNLTEDEQAEWDALDWGDEDVPDAVPPDEINKWLLNHDTVDKMLDYLMTRGIKVAGGDRLGKTIIFARNQTHAEFIVERFDALYPRYKGTFTQVITSKTQSPGALIDKFSDPAREPHIGVSVDMLDTGIDIPEVVNLVFAKAVRSKTKFWQMLGRGTRLCDDLFGPGLHKELFHVFDFGQNFEFFSVTVDPTEAAVQPSLTAQLFTARLELVGGLDNLQAAPALRAETAEVLRGEIAGMDLDSFEVRPHRPLVERFRHATEWSSVSSTDLGALGASLAGLPSERAGELEEVKRFDLLMLKLELALLRSNPDFDRLRARVVAVADALDGKRTQPLVAPHAELLDDLRTDHWWTDVTVELLDDVRKKLRSCIAFVDKRKRNVVYTDFVDRVGTEAEVDFEGLLAASELAQFRQRATAFVRDGKANGAVEKLRTNQPITTADLARLKDGFVEAGIGDADDLDAAANDAGGFGLFVRSLVGLDRAAAKEAFAEFLDEARHNANQIEFVNLVVDLLTERGMVDAARFYQSPFTAVSPLGPEGLFEEDEITRMIDVLHQVRRNAEAA